MAHHAQRVPDLQAQPWILAMQVAKREGTIPSRLFFRGRNARFGIREGAPVLARGIQECGCDVQTRRSKASRPKTAESTAAD
jgi:hypothetical protein